MRSVAHRLGFAGMRVLGLNRGDTDDRGEGLQGHEISLCDRIHKMQTSCTARQSVEKKARYQLLAFYVNMDWIRHGIYMNLKIEISLDKCRN